MMSKMLSIAATIGMLLLFPAASDGSEQPNIVVIMVDDLGYGELTSYGATDLSTPAIDSIANDGIKFTNFYWIRNLIYI